MLLGVGALGFTSIQYSPCLTEDGTKVALSRGHRTRQAENLEALTYYVTVSKLEDRPVSKFCKGTAEDGELLGDRTRIQYPITLQAIIYRVAVRCGGQHRLLCRDITG